MVRFRPPDWPLPGWPVGWNQHPYQLSIQPILSCSSSLLFFISTGNRTENFLQSAEIRFSHPLPQLQLHFARRQCSFCLFLSFLIYSNIFHYFTFSIDEKNHPNAKNKKNKRKWDLTGVEPSQASWFSPVQFTFSIFHTFSRNKTNLYLIAS